MEHVQRRGGRYFWRAHVPSELVAPLNRKEFTKALYTTIARVARERAARLHARLMDIWAEARAMGETGKTAEEIRALLTRLLGTLDAAQADARRGHGMRPRMLNMIEAMERDEVADEVKAAMPALIEAVAAAEAEAGQTARVEAAAQGLGLAALEKLEAILQGAGAKITLKPTPSAIRFLEDVYVTEKQLREDQNRHVENYVRLFARIAGDRPLAEYKRQDILDWVRTLEKLKFSIGKSEKDSGKPIEQLIKESRGKRTLSQTTI